VTDPMHDRVVAAVGDLFLIDDEIGRGGMSVVYAARDLRLNRRVAIKVLPPELGFDPGVRERFRREAQTAAQLNHPHIVPIYTVDDRGGLTYFVMGLIEGESLAQRLAREPTPPLAEATRILGDVADALAYAHAHGVVHRDIKPDNILIERDSGRVFVTDFGIARAAEAGTRITVTGIAVGTPAYMSPEQALGERDVDGRSDLYSLGVVAYQMLAGAPPFTANNTPAMLMKHVGEAPPPLATRRPDLPPNLVTAVERALEKKPEDRWPSAGAFADALRAGEGLSDQGDGARREGRQGTEWRRAGGSGAAHAPAQAPAPAADDRWREWGLGFPPRPATPGAPAASAPVTSRESLRAARREWRAARHEWKRDMRARAELREWEGATSPEDRIRVFRRKLASYVGVVGMLVVINMLTSPWFPWAIFPALGMGVDLMRRAGVLWADGVRLRDVFGSQRIQGAARGGDSQRAVAEGPAPALASPASRFDDEAAKLVPPEVLAGRHGDAVRRALADRSIILEVVSKLAKADKELIPDVAPTVNALVDRVVALSPILHRLDASVSPGAVVTAAGRIAAVEAESQSPDRDRRLALLQRQRTSLEDLLARRDRLAAQLESAGLALQNLTLDVIKLRSSGVQAALHDVASATQEARAVSRDIGHVLDAAAEIRSL
jgi:protein kinase-like protein/2TM domain-containing protein